MDKELEDLSVRVGQALLERKSMLACAESCTGGWVAEVVTATGGSSQWFERGYVTYSNAAKQELLGVRAETLREQGAVSEAVVREMAAGTLRRSHAQAALAISGVAGPTGGSPDKPVGTVCFAWVLRDGVPTAETVHFSGEREAVRRQSVIHALQGLLRKLS
ncbi:MAG: nicotinamide-nucleotide amidase [Rhodocyclaceae bacterium]|jgi:nicotinamide-nucleotide amidase|nr:Nicotinamide-nucleotide amidohydrolase PncC [Rhodocyclaceae bacterium]MBZ0142669.1 nicotinamide-nucleotide amidase [Rhodocyclaceae bacterium]MCC6879168.1 nicotinamide-nucleotide amidase [Rhodocyclaceae bacterium]MCL4682226.1 nicotinamide-nucleotide amidase [Rhodocyclaceae bacterium]